MIEDTFDTPLAARLSQREKQIQQRYRPIIGVHKWFARRPGALFRSLLLSEFVEDVPLKKAYYRGNDLSGKTIGDPFMGGGTPLFEANRVGCSVVGADINPMSHWVVRQELAGIDTDELREAGEKVVADVEAEIGDLYKTECEHCGDLADVKYFLWVKVIDCCDCGESIRLFRNYRVAKNERHPYHVFVCPHCLDLNEIEDDDEIDNIDCSSCGGSLKYEGPARRKYSTCPSCGAENSAQPEEGIPDHQLYAIEYHCSECYSEVEGRQFKAPDENDFDAVKRAERRYSDFGDAHVPDDEIPAGDESDRLLRWGYTKYRELFTDRQLYGLSVLKQRIDSVQDKEIREALITVFSDFLRYQNMVCRYDNWALKIQDIFSVHGFPVSLEQCENSLLGISGVGSGGYRHFLQKYIRAKKYCESPFECTADRTEVQTKGEVIKANFVDKPADLLDAPPRSASLHSESSGELDLDGVQFDGVFTDPPYFANVQYAELIDFCFVWIKDMVNGGIPTEKRSSTRRNDELTVNETEGRGLTEFTEGLSTAYSNFASSLKPGAPFVFTYHHNDIRAYIPVIVAILDARLVCTSTLACPAEMGASVHISGTGSSVVDSVFVCRREGKVNPDSFELSTETVRHALRKDLRELKEGEVSPTMGDARCILLGHVSRLLIWELHDDWNPELSVKEKVERVQHLIDQTFPAEVVDRVTEEVFESADGVSSTDGLFSEMGATDVAANGRSVEFSM